MLIKVPCEVFETIEMHHVEGFTDIEHFIWTFYCSGATATIKCSAATLAATMAKLLEISKYLLFLTSAIGIYS